MKFDVRYANHPEDSKRYDTQELRKHYHIKNLFEADSINLTYSHQDRIIAGGIMPVDEALVLESCKELAAPYFLARRELGAINVGGPGVMVLDGVEYAVNNRDGIYVGMGTKELIFKSVDKNHPAKFYINSCPAHRTCPTVHIPMEKARYNHLGAQETVNERILRQYIHPAVCESCQLSMGMTALLPGNVWNTMPSHTHERRMEVYFYFDIPEGTWRVFFLFKTRSGFDAHKIQYCDKITPFGGDAYLEAVYEPHWEHYSRYFGNTLAGFFSDEPCFGNNGRAGFRAELGRKYSHFPYSDEVMEQLYEKLGGKALEMLPSLWFNTDDQTMQKTRIAYMDIIMVQLMRNASVSVSQSLTASKLVSIWVLLTVARSVVTSN